MRAWKPIAIFLVMAACGDDDSAGDASTSTTDHETGDSCPDLRACERPDDCEMGFYCKDGCCEPIPI